MLYQCGTAPPTGGRIPSDAKMFEIPLTSVAVADTTFIGFMDALEIHDRAAFASQYATSPCFQVLTSNKCGKVAQDPGSDFADKELVAAQEDLVDAIIGSSASKHPKTIAFTATADPSVLKRAEWVKFVSVFFNKEVEANRFYDGVKSFWNKRKISSNGDGPVVAWMNFQDFAGPELVLHFTPYKVEYIKAAGGRTLDKKAIDKAAGWEATSSGYKSVDIDAAKKSLVELLKTVDIVIDETYAQDNAAYTLSKFKSTYGIKEGTEKDFPFLTNKKVFRLDRRVSPGGFGDGLDWFETPVSRPDLVLQDFLHAFGQPGGDGHTRVWLRNISLGGNVVKVTEGECSQNVSGCSFSTKVICPTVVAACDGSLDFRTPSDSKCPAPKCGKD